MCTFEYRTIGEPIGFVNIQIMIRPFFIEKEQINFEQLGAETGGV